MYYLHPFETPADLNRDYKSFDVPINQFYEWWLTIPEIHDRVYLSGGWWWVKPSDNFVVGESKRNYCVNTIGVHCMSPTEAKQHAKHNADVVEYVKFLHERDIDLDWIVYVSEGFDTKISDFSVAVKSDTEPDEFYDCIPADWTGVYCTVSEKDKASLLQRVEHICKLTDFTCYSMVRLADPDEWVIFLGRTQSDLPTLPETTPSVNSPLSREEQIKQLEAQLNQLRNEA